ncbi:MAG: CbtB-domain containing protein [Rhodocyclales bacterium]|jgi:cobalt transporter subunit CbtB|nr:CbtB-domain containing protein [Rhodocyclales bacterium]
MHNQATLNLPRARGAIVAAAQSLCGAMLIGIVIVYGAGFSHSAAAHNAAHDTRHANVFPCH